MISEDLRLLTIIRARRTRTLSKYCTQSKAYLLEEGGYLLCATRL